MQIKLSGMSTFSHLISYKNSKKVSASVSASRMSNISQIRVLLELSLTPTVSHAVMGAGSLLCCVRLEFVSLTTVMRVLLWG